MREPFILLDDARGLAEASPARLYRGARTIFSATGADAVAPTIGAAIQAARDGAHVAGQIAYEAGYALEPRLAGLIDEEAEPLVWLAAFDGYEQIDAADVPAWLAQESDAAPGPAHLSPLMPEIERAAYNAAFSALSETIRAGDIYQANLTFPLCGGWAGDPLAIYAAIRARAAAGYGGIVFDGERWSLSFSPELFFALKDGAVTLKPMKGTRPRGADAVQDAALRAELAESDKDRAENLMITDLMRNDVSRVAAPGSVRVENPHAIESYPTVHQMVTTIRAQLNEGFDAGTLFSALFPCGSITGAPKIRAMELIREHEKSPRGVYCGAIGRFDPDGGAAFNVAIRTLRLTDRGTARLGIGSAIVAGSSMDGEWNECLLKGAFANGATPPLRLIETMKFDPDIGIPLIEAHLERLKASAAALGFVCDRHALRNDIQAYCFMNREPARLRVLVDMAGAWEIGNDPMPAPLPDPVPVLLVPLPVDPADWRLRHKTTDRAFYDDARAEAAIRGAAEAVLVRDDGFLTEGTISNVFVERGGVLLTPPAARGLLPGVMRRTLLETGQAREADLTAADLADGFFVGNALRGLLRARLMA